MTKILVLLLVVFSALWTTAFSKQPLRLPNGTYTYSLSEGNGPPEFTSTIDVRSNGPTTFAVSETVKLPGGQIATTQSVWSSVTLLPKAFDVHQGNINLHSLISREKLTFIGRSRSFQRIPDSAAILPSVGLISTDLMFAYFLAAHPGEAVTLAEIQNNQTVIVRSNRLLATASSRYGHATLTMTKQEKHGVASDLEQIVGSLNRRTGILDNLIANPGDARIVLMHYSPSGR